MPVFKLKRSSWLISMALSAMLMSPAGYAADPVAGSAASAQAQDAAQEDFLLLEARLEGLVLSESLNAYQKDNRLFLPLGQLSQLLQVAIQVDPALKRAKGFILRESNAFELDVDKQSVRFGGRQEHIGSDRIILDAEDIYIEQALLERWLPIDVSLDSEALRLTIGARESLPVLERSKREERFRRLGERSEKGDPNAPQAKTPYRMLGVPVVDQTIDIAAGKGGSKEGLKVSHVTQASLDIFGMNGSVTLSGSKDEPADEMQVVLGRVDPGATLLGPLKARQIKMGHVSMPSVANVSRNHQGGAGLLVSNHDLSRPDTVDRHTLEGPLPPGWDVELMANGALVGYRKSDANARYRFADLALSYGLNEYVLVFHGPQGETRTEVRRFLLEDTLARKGEVRYRAAYQHDGEQADRGLAEVEYGLTSRVTAAASHQVLPIDGKPVQYSKAGLRASTGRAFLNADLIRSSEGGLLAEVGAKTRIGRMNIHASHAAMQDFYSEELSDKADPVQTRDKLGIQGSIPLGATRVLPVSAELKQERLASGNKRLQANGRVSTQARGAVVTNSLTFEQTGDANPEVTGSLQASRMIRKTYVRGEAQYEVAPDRKIKSLSVTASRPLQDYQLQGSLTRQFDTGDYLLEAGLGKQVGRYAVTATTGYSTAGEVTAGVQLGWSVGRNPVTGKWVSHAQRQSQTGSVVVEVFLDRNNNGRQDAGEPRIKNAGFDVDGNHHDTATDAEGRAFLTHLSTDRYITLTLNEGTLEDPRWSPAAASVNILPRPGEPARVAFAVVALNELEGVAYRMKDGQKQAVSGLTVELVDSKGEVVQTTRTEADGLYILEKVSPGDYLLRIKGMQLSEAQVQSLQKRVTVKANSDIMSGLDFELPEA